MSTPNPVPTVTTSKFTVRKFAEIPKIVGRGAKAGSTGRPSTYPFADMKEEGDGFEFLSALTKKVRGAVQAYRGNFPQYKFAIRELRDETTGQLTGSSACILHKILTPEELAELQAQKAAQKAAEAAAEAAGVGPIVPANAPVAAPVQDQTVVAASVDDALSGLDL